MRATLRKLCMALAALPFAQPLCAAPFARTATAHSTSVSKKTLISAHVRQRERPTVRRPMTLAAEKLAVGLGDVKRSLSTARSRLEKNRELFDEAKLKGELEYLEGVSSEADFWNDGTAARKTLGSLNRCVRCAQGWGRAVWVFGFLLLKCSIVLMVVLLGYYVLSLFGLSCVFWNHMLPVERS